jgi:succinate dehydrogenase/fumarate reductase flavoprotein subunit
MIADAAPPPPLSVTSAPSARGKDGRERKGDPAEVVARLRRRAWESLGLERDGGGLRALLGDLADLGAAVEHDPLDRPSAEARNLVAVAQAMASGALFREESRGGHFRTDFPEHDDVRFLGHTLLTEDGPQLLAVDASPIGVAR